MRKQRLRTRLSNRDVASPAVPTGVCTLNSPFCPRTLFTLSSSEAREGRRRTGAAEYAPRIVYIPTRPVRCSAALRFSSVSVPSTSLSGGRRHSSVHKHGYTSPPLGAIRGLTVNDGCARLFLSWHPGRRETKRRGRELSLLIASLLLGRAEVYIYRGYRLDVCGNILTTRWRCRCN